MAKIPYNVSYKQHTPVITGSGSGDLPQYAVFDNQIYVLKEEESKMEWINFGGNYAYPNAYLDPNSTCSDRIRQFEQDQKYAQMYEESQKELELSKKQEENKIYRSMIKRVISKPDDNMTIVIWNDGTKTIVYCQEDEVFDAEKGLMACCMKKMFGNDSMFNEIIRKWIDFGEEDNEDDEDEDDGWLDLMLHLTGRDRYDSI